MKPWTRKTTLVSIATIAVLVGATTLAIHESAGPGTFTVAQTNAIMNVAVPIAEQKMSVTQGQLCFSISLQGLDVGTQQVVDGYDQAAPANRKRLNKQAVHDYLASLCSADLKSPITDM